MVRENRKGGFRLRDGKTVGTLGRQPRGGLGRRQAGDRIDGQPGDDVVSGDGVPSCDRGSGRPGPGKRSRGCSRSPSDRCHECLHVRPARIEANKHVPGGDADAELAHGAVGHQRALDPCGQPRIPAKPFHAEAGTPGDGGKQGDAREGPTRRGSRQGGDDDPALTGRGSLGGGGASGRAGAEACRASGRGRFQGSAPSRPGTRDGAP